MQLPDTLVFLSHVDRRSRIERRQFIYDVHIPERRLGVERRRLHSMARATAAAEPETPCELAEELPQDRPVVHRKRGH
jgi:hypothetical protein